MGVPRMIQGQFGAINYDSGVLDPGIDIPTAATVAFNESLSTYFGVRRHNDVFYEQTPGGALAPGALHFMTYQYVDLRDLLEEKACMDDVVINVQRLNELPFPNLSYNLPPGNIVETFLVLLGDYNLDAGNGPMANFSVANASKAGFVPLNDPTGTDSQGGLPFEVLYREVRNYQQDPSQNFLSPDQVGSQAGPSGDAAQAPTRFVGNYKMVSRTIGGYPDLLVGPGLTIVRAWSVYTAQRTSQSLNGGGPSDAPADELTFLSMRNQLEIPALQYNIVGTQRPLTATETATYYSNILMKS